MADTRNPGLVKEVMGHESLDTTMGYLHPETSQIKVVIDRLNHQKYLMQSQPQKLQPQWSRGMDGDQPQVDKDGERGRNRTFNLLIKSSSRLI
jgi:hypothetical protein